MRVKPLLPCVFNSLNNFITGASMSFSLTKLFHETGIKFITTKVEKWVNGVLFLLLLHLCLGENFCRNKDITYLGKALFS